MAPRRRRSDQSGMIKYSSDTVVFFFLTIITYNLEIFIVLLVQADNGLIMRDIPGERVVKEDQARDPYGNSI